MAVFTFAGSVTPGPNNVMLAASGANFGFRRSSGHMLGVLVGASVLLYAVALGTGALFVALPALQLAIKIAGAIFLLYLAWRIAPQHLGRVTLHRVANSHSLPHSDFNLPTQRPGPLRQVRRRHSCPPTSTQQSRQAF